MEMHVGHAGAMIAYAGLVKLFCKHFCKLRMGTQQLDYMVFVAFRTRLGYVNRHALGSADIEMRYYVEYFFHLLRDAKLAINAQTTVCQTLLNGI